jgi:antitoxin (DNA-binding transcriptional repressor) of toxin-antitoxin stability system
VAEAMANFSRYLEVVTEGETVLICNGGVAVAELRGLPSVPMTPRPIGLGKGTFEVASTFFECLPDEVLRSWEA